MGAQLELPRGAAAAAADRGRPLRGISYEMPVASAQVKSCLLLAGLLAEGETSVVEPMPSRDHSERMLAAAGAEVDRERRRRSRSGPPSGCAGRDRGPGRLLGRRLLHRRRATIVPGSAVALTGVGLNPTRTGLLEILGRMGAAVEVEDAATSAASRAASLRVSRRRAARRPRSAAPRSRWRSTSCRWSRSPPASPRARRRSATPRSCVARRATGSRPYCEALTRPRRRGRGDRGRHRGDGHRRPARRHGRLPRRSPDRDDGRRRRARVAATGSRSSGMDAAAISYPGFEADLAALAGGGRTG